MTFLNGAVARERLISVDDEARRLAWTIVEGRYAHHNGTLEVHEDGDGCRLVWTTDLLPDELATASAGGLPGGPGPALYGAGRGLG